MATTVATSRKESIKLNVNLGVTHSTFKCFVWGTESRTPALDEHFGRRIKFKTKWEKFLSSDQLSNKYPTSLEYTLQSRETMKVLFNLNRELLEKNKKKAIFLLRLLILYSGNNGQFRIQSVFAN